MADLQRFQQSCVALAAPTISVSANFFRKSLQQRRHAHPKAVGKGLNGSEPRFMLAVFKVGDKHASKAGVRGQIHLVPTTLLPQFADPFAKSEADILMCHVAMMHVLFTLRVASALRRDGAFANCICGRFC